LADPSPQLQGDRAVPAYRNLLPLPGVAQGDANARVAASCPQALGPADSAGAPLANSGAGRSVSQERFDRCLDSAELYLRQGRYYRAAELFTLAAAYQPNDGRAHLGRSYALFAAGEYLSSALYLARALELDPRAVLGRSDLVEAIGGPGVFAGRITDLEQCAGTGDAPQLQFLLAYVYSQMNRPAEAQAALAAAQEHLSPSLALDLLKAVIYRP
jgi:tetratricopeptide (TPR) repeat protein